VDWGVLTKVLDELAEACTVYDQPRILGLMKQLVPEHAESHADTSAPQAAKTAIS
jgi:hypothetical protein